MPKDRRLRIGLGIGLATYVLMVALFPADTFAQAGRVLIVIALAYLTWKGHNWARILLGVWFALLGVAAILALFANAAGLNVVVALLIGGGFIAAAGFVLAGRRDPAVAPEPDHGTTTIDHA